MVASKCSNALVTINNPGIKIPTFSDKVVFAIWQREIGENETEHYQMYVEMKTQSTFKQIQVAIDFEEEKPHIESRRGTQKQAIDYCSKEDTRVDGPWSHGEKKAGQGERTDVIALHDAVRAKRSFSSMCEEFPQMIKYHRGVRTMLDSLAPKRQKKTKCLWLWGPTGTGKSRTAWQLCPDAYEKPGGTPWWDGYDSEKCVIIDDLRGDTFKFHELLKLLDRYPLKLPVKGGHCQFCAEIVIITSSMRPDDMYSRSEEDMAQLMRRIEMVTLMHASTAMSPYNSIIDFDGFDFGLDEEVVAG